MFEIKNNYNYSCLEKDLKILSSYPEVKIFSIGKSVWYKEIFCIKIGSGSKNVFFNGAHHGLEWITSPLLIKFCYELLTNNKTRVCGYDIENILKKYNISHCAYG